MNLAELILHSLKAHGAQAIFGIPGDFALPFFKVLEESELLPLYTLSHEPGIGFAADACGRFQGGLGVAAVTYGAGALNMVNPVAGAYAEKVPLVVLAGAPGEAESANGMLLHHQVKTLDSQFRIYEEITCAQARLHDPATAAAELARVLRTCLEESRPVLIEIPRDQVFKPVPNSLDDIPVLPASPYRQEAVEACAEAILRKLDQAIRPTLLVGVEIRRFGLEAKVAELASRLQMPVVTTFMGRGLLASTPVQVLGTYLGAACEERVRLQVEQSDGLFMLGVILSDTNFAISVEKIQDCHAIHAADRCVRLGYHEYANIPLTALLDALLARLPATAWQPMQAIAPTAPARPPQRSAQPAPLSPVDIAQAISALMQRHGKMPIASDMGDCLFTALDMDYTELVAPGYYATMGYGVPAGLGIQAASGQRPLILVGDGAFQMTGWELGNCRRYGWNPIVVVFNNASWEMLRVFQPESRFSQLGEWDYHSLANALGGRGQRVHNRADLDAALESAWQDKSGFQLVEVMLQPGQLSSTLSRFVESFKAKRLRDQG
ncbi:indolepyruvate/phenylpyruvate decarboxylase [Balneatrix alpica]|uniref:indolepyruvate/phenylpyruvate decarboxylase n=1 Tax=Balneatrix alpica TaxID=75684 RepID=UPI002738A3F6|nr:indolepyruvate/phenylpyruvate decarboxylase [Balneatrix alpica]